MHVKSIFRKQLILYMGSLFVSFFMLAIVLSVVYTEHYMKEMERQLVEQGSKISEEYTKALFTGNTSDLSNELQILETYMDASVFFLNQNGEIGLVSSGINQKWIGQTITDEAIKSVLDGKIVTVEGKINGMFAESVLTVGYPIQIGNRVLGGIFMCTSMPEIERSLSGMYKGGLISIIFIMVIGAFLVFASSRKISRPLLEMNEAVKVMAGGNFEKRIEIESEDEVGQLAEGFNNMAESLYKHEKIRRDFIANVSHDLRSPLTSIQGFLNAILDGTIPKEKQEHYLNVVLEETKRLVKLTNDIVDLSRAQASNIALEKSIFDINAMIRDSLAKFETRFKEKNIELNVLFEEQETSVFADRDKIERVFHNLVDNALKFSEQDGKIKIETTIQSKDKVLISVKDTGKGISEEDKKYVFDRFYKADTSRGKDKKGGGLGLSIAREFILAHDETIAVKSQLDEGTEFLFTLKIANETIK